MYCTLASIVRSLYQPLISRIAQPHILFTAHGQHEPPSTATNLNLQSSRLMPIISRTTIDNKYGCHPRQLAQKTTITRPTRNWLSNPAIIWRQTPSLPPRHSGLHPFGRPQLSPMPPRPPSKRGRSSMPPSKSPFPARRATEDRSNPKVAMVRERTAPLPHCYTLIASL